MKAVRSGPAQMLQTGAPGPADQQPGAGDPPGASHGSQATQGSPASRRELCSLLVAVPLAFAAGWASTSAVAVWQYRAIPRKVCEQHLKMLYVASRQLPAEERRPQPALGAVIRVLAQPFLLTGRDSRYLDPAAEAHPMRYTGASLDTLLCMEDPTYGEQIGIAMSADPRIEPSYYWCPDGRTFAYCPYHQLAVLRNGTLEVR